MQDITEYFNGTIIITDPFYILNANNPEDWDKCARGNKMEMLGLNTYVTMLHVQPDMNWTIIQPGVTEDKPFIAIGKFHVNTGNASVFLLDELLAYNPDYDHTKDQRLVAIIPHFNGNIKVMYKHDVGPEVATIIGSNATNDNLMFYTVPDKSSYVPSE